MAARSKQPETVVGESKEALMEAQSAAKDAVKKAKAELVVAEAKLDLATHRRKFAGVGVGSDTEAGTRRIIAAKESAVEAARAAV
jgi:hypothetical protein